MIQSKLCHLPSAQRGIYNLGYVTWMFLVLFLHLENEGNENIYLICLVWRWNKKCYNAFMDYARAHDVCPINSVFYDNQSICTIKNNYNTIVVASILYFICYIEPLALFLNQWLWSLLWLIIKLSSSFWTVMIWHEAKQNS